nr:MAG TPA: putative HNHc nuclease [Caudoviricetes sp.]
MGKRQKSIMPGDTAEWCYLCSRHGRLEVHHCLHGRNRRAADEMGLTVHLCGECHRRLHDKGEHDRELEALAQETYEGLHGHAAWMARVGKNFAEVDG